MSIETLTKDSTPSDPNYFETRHYVHSENGISLHVNLGFLSEGTLLQDRVIMITGGSKGIGYAIADACIRQGAKVILSGRHKDALEEACEELGEDSAYVVFDTRDIDAFDAVIEKAVSHFGPIDSLINNAGISLREGDFLNVTTETWDRQFDTNLKGPFFLTQAWFRRYYADKLKSGRVIMIGSDTSGMGNSTPYGLTKNALASLTIGLAKRFITEGIRINAVCPGTTMTDMASYTGGEFCRESTQGKRVIYPEEIAQTVLFLLSDLSTCISGQVIGCTESNICFNNMAREAETNP